VRALRLLSKEAQKKGHVSQSHRIHIRKAGGSGNETDEEENNHR